MKLILFLLISVFVSKASGAESGKLPIAVPRSLESSVHMRDPFRRILPKKSAENDLASIPEIERLPLEQFRLVGVITGPKKHKALITAPSGKMHILSELARIGPRKGVIKKILSTRIEVEERVINLLGEEEKLYSSLELSEKKTDGSVSGSGEKL